MYMCSFLMRKTRVLTIAILTVKVTLWGHPIRGIYRANLSRHDCNMFEESWAWWLWIIEKRNVSVCRGHEFANALYILCFLTHRSAQMLCLQSISGQNRLIYTPCTVSSSDERDMWQNMRSSQEKPINMKSFIEDVLKIELHNLKQKALFARQCMSIILLSGILVEQCGGWNG